MTIKKMCRKYMTACIHWLWWLSRNVWVTITHLMDYNSVYIEDPDVYSVAITLKATEGDCLSCGWMRACKQLCHQDRTSRSFFFVPAPQARPTLKSLHLHPWASALITNMCCQSSLSKTGLLFKGENLLVHSLPGRVVVPVSCRLEIQDLL